jgi:hypothetical protein
VVCAFKKQAAMSSGSKSIFRISKDNGISFTPITNGVDLDAAGWLLTINSCGEGCGRVIRYALSALGVPTNR